MAENDSKVPNDPKGAPPSEEVAPSDKSIPQKSVVVQEGKQTEDKSTPPASDTKSPAQGEKLPESPPGEKPPNGKGTPPKPKKPGKAVNSKKKTPLPPNPETEGKNKSGGKSEKPETSPETPPPEKLPTPREAPRPKEPDQITYIKLSDLHPFKDHPFSVQDDAELSGLIESVKDKGVTQAITVRPREGGGFEIVSGHRRYEASLRAGYTDIRSTIKILTDEQAITEMVEDNTSQRARILPSERARALKMQLDAIKRQGTRGGDPKDAGTRSNQIVADRNGMSVKNVQRYISLNKLSPELMQMVDAKKIKFMPAVELAEVRRKLHPHIAQAIEAEKKISHEQAERMKTLDKKGMLTPDAIDGIMLEGKQREDDKVIIKSAELEKYFGSDKTPREMKEVIISLLDERAKSLGIAPQTPNQGKDK